VWLAFNLDIVLLLLPCSGMQVICRDGETTVRWTGHSTERPVAIQQNGFQEQQRSFYHR
jgi:hypothetical protein